MKELIAPDVVTGAAFLHNGFARLRAFLAPGELGRVRSSVEELVGRPRDPCCTRPHNTLVPLRWCDDLVDLLLGSRRRIDAIRRAVGGTDLRWISGYVSIKAPHSGPLWWHQDWWCWDHDVSFRAAASQVAVLCYPDATDRTNGALRVLPGSHHTSSDIHAAIRDAHVVSAGQPDSDHAVFRDHARQLTLGMTAGDAVVLDYRLLHGTHANDGVSARNCLIMNFAPSWSELPRDIRAHLVSQTALPGAGETTIARHSWSGSLLPRFDGVRRDLDLNRIAPAAFQIPVSEPTCAHRSPEDQPRLRRRTSGAPSSPPRFHLERRL